MPRFHFPLISLLRVRQMLERQRYLTLQRANQRVAASQQRILEAASALRASQTAWIAEASAGVTSAELQFVRECECNCKLAIAQAQQEHSKLVAWAITEREAYLAMKRPTQVVEHLHDRAFDAWLLEESRREQQQVDELFLMRLRMAVKPRERRTSSLSPTTIGHGIAVDPYRQESSDESAPQVNS